MTTSMAREIDECGAAVARCLTENNAAFAALAHALRARNPPVVVTHARGSSDHAALYLKYLIEIELGLPCASIGPSIASLAARAALVAAWSDDAAFVAALRELPDTLAPPKPPPPALVETLAAAPAAFVLGRGSTFAIAAEAALKLKETCAIHAEAFSAAEVMHGPAEIVRPGFLVVAFAPRDEAADGFAAALDRFRALGARVVSITSGGEDGDDNLAAAASPHPLIAPIPMIHRFYALAEATARRLGRDPDRPINLKKVTETR